jgi:hypothetical protein
MVLRRSSARLAAAPLILMLAMMLPGQLFAQASLGTPNATFPEDFGTIQTVREMPDGRVLVADPLGKALYMVDMDAGTRTVIGSEGQGPEEYLQPDAVWALPGDSTLLVDLGNGRLVALGPDLGFGPTSPIGLGDPRSNLTLALPQGIDRNGNVYARAMGSPGSMMEDSAAILRISRASSVIDEVADFKLQERKRTESGTANNQNVSISPVPLSPEDAWGVAPDGSIAIARSGDYHVEWVGPDGTMLSGSPIPFDAVRIGTAEKEEYVAAQGRTGGGIGISVGISNGEVQMGFSRGGAGGGPREIDQYDWPDRKPPFYSGRLSIDGESRVWVRRHVDAGDPSTYDVFDRQGQHVATLTLEHGKRIVGFGDSSIYVVSYDQFDLNYLERYDLPAT